MPFSTVCQCHAIVWSMEGPVCPKWRQTCCMWSNSKASWEACWFCTHALCKGCRCSAVYMPSCSRSSNQHSGFQHQDLPDKQIFLQMCMTYPAQSARTQLHSSWLCIPSYDNSHSTLTQQHRCACRFECLDCPNHWLTWEVPDKLNSLILEHIKKNDP